MSNDLAVLTHELPELPSELKSQVSALVVGAVAYPGTAPDDPGLRVAPTEPWFDLRAAALVPAYRAACAPPDPLALQTWLMRLNAAVRNPQPREASALRIAAIATACSDIPRGAWTLETLAEALRAFEWWPSAAEVYKLLQPHGKRLTGTLEALEKIAKAGPRMIAREAIGYKVETAPGWADSRRIRHNDNRDDAPVPSNARPPVRTVDEQLAALGHPR